MKMTRDTYAAIIRQADPDNAEQVAAAGAAMIAVEVLQRRSVAEIMELCAAIEVVRAEKS